MRSNITITFAKNNLIIRFRSKVFICCEGLNTSIIPTLPRDINFQYIFHIIVIIKIIFNKLHISVPLMVAQTRFRLPTSVRGFLIKASLRWDPIASSYWNTFAVSKDLPHPIINEISASTKPFSKPRVTIFKISFPKGFIRTILPLGILELKRFSFNKLLQHALVKRARLFFAVLKWSGEVNLWWDTTYLYSSTSLFSLPQKMSYKPTTIVWELPFLKDWT